MANELESRIIHLESIIAQQDRVIDTLSEEILRLNRLYEKLVGRVDAFETRQANESLIRPLSEEVPPPHY